MGCVLDVAACGTEQGRTFIPMHIISSVVQENTKASCIDVTDPE